MWEVLEASESPAPDCPNQRKSFNSYNPPFPTYYCRIWGLWPWDRKILDADSHMSVIIRKQLAS